MFAEVCCNLLEFSEVCWNMLEFAGVCLNILEFLVEFGGVGWCLLQLAGGILEFNICKQYKSSVQRTAELTMLI